MSASTGGKDPFISNLNKIYAGYTGGFLAFVVILGILEQLGVPDRIIGYLFVFLTIGVYAYIGIISRTAQVAEYYVAGRKVPAVYNGMATGSDWMSAASFIGMAGSLYALGYGGLAFILGWTGGYMLVAVLLAPYLRKFGQYTVPDFLGARYGGNVARAIGVAVLITASFVYVVAQIVGVGIITQRFLDVSFGVAVFLGLAGILVCSMLGGMRAVTWTQVAQYIILIIAYLIPAILMSVKVTGVPLPQLMYGVALERIEGLEAAFRAAGQTPPPGVVGFHTAPFIGPNGQFSMSAAVNFFALVFCLMVGTAALPHILMRYFTTPSVREARASVAWSLFFIFLLYFTAPAYAAFGKLEIYQNFINQPIAALPEWVRNWQIVSPYGVPWINIVDANRDGILQWNEFRIHPDVVVLATRSRACPT
jgi:cation/acetate symporter